MTQPSILNLPEHVAIIMDGNRRWAKQRGLHLAAGHKKVADEVLEELIEYAGKIGIPYMTFWAFSTENWGRSKIEVRAIMEIFRWGLKKKIDKLIKKGARVRFIGDLSMFDTDIRQGMEEAMNESKDNGGITVTFAVNYGGRDEIARAIFKIVELLNCQNVKETHRFNNNLSDNMTIRQYDSIKIEELSKDKILELLPEFLDTEGLPDPDLIIRTSGEQRLSGFMPWQSVYAELYFPEVLMPDFGVEEFEKAISEFQRRKRRFGK